MEQNRMPDDKIPAKNAASKGSAGVKGKRGMFEIEKLEHTDPTSLPEAGDTAADAGRGENKSSGSRNSY